ncbi:MAG TPA: hypothetical protein VGX25_32325 [Actinophytocola sp.]|uniref:hypothetical protein n=1 Tax=Actinophytocola sp. TaxID=1872138 RepID=UPI002DDC9B26|nr:hypothetical protein [Actinophytocola sp.]HEV2784099.1 hypothetical protein [Actinophytocola sp.]
MARSILELDGDALWTAFEQINPVDLLVDELTGRTDDRVDWNPHHLGRFVAWQRTTKDDDGTERALLEDPGTGERCLLPADGLRASRTATLGALAARQMLTPTVVTATVLGTSPAAQLQLAVIARHVPDVSHIAVCPTPGGGFPLEPRVVDQVDLAGIGLSVTSGMAEAVFGANLVIIADGGPWPLIPGQLPRGAVVVNATGQDLPVELVNGVDEIYVDDAKALEANRHRYFIRSHLSSRIGVGAPTRTTGGRRRPHIEAPLGEVLTGGHPGRTHLDDTLLVELLSTDTLDAQLACELHRAALERGLGVRRSE